MSDLREDIFEEHKKNSEKRNKKLKIAGKTISYLYLALFFGVGIFVAKELWASLEWYRIAGMLIIVLAFSVLSMMIEKKTKGIEKHSISAILTQLVITVFMFFSIVIFYNLTSEI